MTKKTTEKKPSAQSAGKKKAEELRRIALLPPANAVTRLCEFLAVQAEG